MKTTPEFEGSTVREAVAAAAESLGIPEEELDYELLDEGRRGVLGMGARPCRIRVTADVIESLPQKSADEPAPESAEGDRPARRRRRGRGRGRNRRRRSQGDPGEARRDRPVEEAPAEESAELNPTQRSVVETAGQMVELIGLNVAVRGLPTQDGVRVKMAGPDRKLLVQKDAQLVGSLQFLLNRMARRRWPEMKRIQVQCEGFRNDRDQELIALVKEVASQVESTGHSKQLHEMNPYERRLVHLTVREMGGLSTRSDGDEFLKRITIEPGDGAVDH